MLEKVLTSQCKKVNFNRKFNLSLFYNIWKKLRVISICFQSGYFIHNLSNKYKCTYLQKKRIISLIFYNTFIKVFLMFLCWAWFQSGWYDRKWEASRECPWLADVKENEVILEERLLSRRKRKQGGLAVSGWLYY